MATAAHWLPQAQCWQQLANKAISNTVKYLHLWNSLNLHTHSAGWKSRLLTCKVKPVKCFSCFYSWHIEDLTGLLRRFSFSLNTGTWELLHPLNTPSSWPMLWKTVVHMRNSVPGAQLWPIYPIPSQAERVITVCFSSTVSAHWGMDVALIEVLPIASFGINPLVKIGNLGIV